MDLPILKYLDVLVGFSVVMILGTTLVAAVTQLLLSSLYVRARTLRVGLEQLIRQLDPKQLDAASSRMIAQLLMRHPLLARPRSPVAAFFFNAIPNQFRKLWGLRPLPWVSPTDVVQRSELVVLLMEWAAGKGPLAEAAPALKDQLRLVLGNNGIDNPAAMLRSVRLQAIENEKSDPTLPAHLWWTQALLKEAKSDLLGKINQSFDNAIARVSQAFRLKANLVASLVSLVVVFSIQLDSLALLKRLSVDDRLRDSLVKEAEMITERIEKAKAPAEAREKEQERAAQEAQKARAARDEIDKTLALMREPRLAIIPEEATLGFDWEDLLHPRPGLLLSWVLLSLGTPFWFNLLKNMLNLRSALARKDDTERSERERRSTPPKTA
ncbi:MAG: hypothetical protein FJW34_05925 [Acidobacteria bacterium]|nr:hypothetical protein [Acidobacteriota bacterium]